MRCRHQLLVACLALTLCVVGCTQYEDRRAAEQVLDQYFDALKHRRYEAALAAYDKHFFEDVTRAEWRSALASVGEKLGSFRSYEVSRFGSAYKTVAGPGTYLRFQCNVSYSKHSSEETIFLIRKQGATAFKIVGHQIESDALHK